jgi:hypothetical protein
MKADVHDLADSPAVPAEFFRRHGYFVVRQLIEPALTAFLWSYAHTKFASMLMNLADKQVAKTPTDYGDPAFDGLLEYLRPQVERTSGLRLLPTYSYFRFYKHGDVLKRHRDRPACEISVSLNIGQKPLDPWQLWIENQSGPHAASLRPGDALLYRGIDLPHWRDAYQGEALVQVFLHYVDRDGPHADQKFDGRPTLMRHKEGPAPKANNAETGSAV